MKGVVLAGGMGTRLAPATEVTNKHLLPVYNKPMIFYPIETLAKAGIKDILIVVGGNSIGDILDLCGSGKRFGVNLTYKVQDEAGGIAQALSLAEGFIGEDRSMVHDNMCVILGDNCTDIDISKQADDFSTDNTFGQIFLKEVTDPERFGCPVFENGQIIKIEEKPKKPQSKFAVTGIYFYDWYVFDYIRELKPSKRGELEITDVNNGLIEDGRLSFNVIDAFWSDAGTPESLFKASEYWRNKKDATSSHNG